MTLKEWITLGIGFWAALVASVTAIVAAIVYRMNAKTKRAEFLRDLHKSFFEDDKYEAMRKELDNKESEGASASRFKLIKEAR